tara:strand:- start:359 stop:643 length:285 start_codon:yes stop_codon:yes gene_type:complete
MKWLIVALLLLPSGELNMIHNQEISFSDKKSCLNYVLTNGEQLQHGINIYLNSLFDNNHEIKINGISCLDEETYNSGKDYDKEKAEMDKLKSVE